MCVKSPLNHSSGLNGANNNQMNVRHKVTHIIAILV